MSRVSHRFDGSRGVSGGFVSLCFQRLQLCYSPEEVWLVSRGDIQATEVGEDNVDCFVAHRKSNFRSLGSVTRFANCLFFYRGNRFCHMIFHL